MTRSPIANTRSRRGGFTLVELLAASVVLSMLLLVLVSVARTSRLQSARAADLSRRFPSTGLAGEHIERDLRNASGLQVTRDGVAMFGPISTDAGSGLQTLQPARVQYQVRRIGGHTVLLRSEQSGRGQNTNRIVWIGASALRVEPVEPAPPASLDVRATGGLSPMPASLRVRILDASGNAIWEQIIRHHREVR